MTLRLGLSVRRAETSSGPGGAPRQNHVRQDEVDRGFCLTNEDTGRLGIGRSAHMVSKASQHAAHQAQDILIVFDKKNMLPAALGHLGQGTWLFG